MNVLIYGVRRQGKSTLSLALALAVNSRVAIFDPNNQFPLIQSTSMDGLRTWVEWSENRKPADIALIRVGPFDSEEIAERFQNFSEILFEVPNLSVIVD